MNKNTYLQRFQIKPFKSAAQEAYFRRLALADEVSKWSGGKLPIPMLMAWIKGKGERFLRQIWDETKNEKVNDPVKLLKWKFGQIKIQKK